MLRQNILDEIKQAMKSHDSMRLGVYRFLYSEIKNVEIDAKHELADEEIVPILHREIKKRSEAIAQYKAANRQDIVESETMELKIIEEITPKLMGESEILAVIDKIVARLTDKNFGKVIKEVMVELKGKADGRLVSDLVRQKLSG